MGYVANFNLTPRLIPQVPLTNNTPRTSHTRLECGNLWKREVQVSLGEEVGKDKFVSQA